MELTACELCGSSHSRLKIAQRDLLLGTEIPEFHFVECGVCGLIYLNPRPSMEEISRFYPENYYPLEEPRERRPIDRFFQRISNGLKEGIREEFYDYPQRNGFPRSTMSRILRKLFLYPEYIHLRLVGREILPFRGKGRILDVGCGPGKLLRVLRDWGWDTYGVDFSPAAVNFAREKYQLNVDLGTIFDPRYASNYFDMVMFNHSLEHVYDPVDTLIEAYRILKPGGTLLITIPNADSFEACVFGKWWIQWDPPRHLYHFTRKTMSRMLIDTGFNCIRIDTGKSGTFFLGSVDYVYKYVLGVNRRSGKFMKHLVARPVCWLMGQVGFGTELKVSAEKPQT